jgi:predicted O-linked N-acetylglucosamine transferase (SPINDLY family)
MGVPVITLAGSSTASRSGAAVLGRVGLHSFISNSEEEYVGLALKWSNDLQALAEVRRGLRERMNAPELHPAVVTERIEEAFKRMWGRWLESQQSQSYNAQTGLA